MNNLINEHYLYNIIKQKKNIYINRINHDLKLILDKIELQYKYIEEINKDIDIIIKNCPILNECLYHITNNVDAKGLDGNGVDSRLDGKANCTTDQTNYMNDCGFFTGMEVLNDRIKRSMCTYTFNGNINSNNINYTTNINNINDNNKIKINNINKLRKEIDKELELNYKINRGLEEKERYNRLNYMRNYMKNINK
eukprot:GHVP01031862.1.p1 GENE.GHVP01031862.1~~GHVP01031862.1.p1  ORF type:complete len:196 (-),score=12.93 GHVP01031862.1:288-875(-)